MAQSAFDMDFRENSQRDSTSILSGMVVATSESHKFAFADNTTLDPSWNHPDSPPNGIDFARARVAAPSRFRRKYRFLLHVRLVYGNGTRAISRIAVGIFRNSRAARRS